MKFIGNFKNFLSSFLFLSTSFYSFASASAVEYENPPVINLIGDSFMYGLYDATKNVYGVPVKNLTNGGTYSLNIFNDFPHAKSQWSKYGKNVEKDELFKMYFWEDVNHVVLKRDGVIVFDDFPGLDNFNEYLNSNINLAKKVTDSGGFLIIDLHQLKHGLYGYGLQEPGGDLFFLIGLTSDNELIISRNFDPNPYLIQALKDNVKNLDRVILMNGFIYEDELANKAGFPFVYFRNGSPEDGIARDHHLNQFQAVIRANYEYNTTFAPVVLSSAREVVQDQVQINGDHIYSRIQNALVREDGFSFYGTPGVGYNKNYKFDKISSGFPSSWNWNFTFNFAGEYKFENGFAVGLRFARDKNNVEYKSTDYSVTHVESGETVEYRSSNHYKINVTNLSASLYGVYPIDNFYVTGMFSFGDLKYDFNRHIGKIKNLPIEFNGKTDGYQISGMAGVGYYVHFNGIFRFNTGFFLDGSNVVMKDFKETGSVETGVIKYQIPDLSSVSAKFRAEFGIDKNLWNFLFASPSIGFECEREFVDYKPVKFKLDNIAGNHFALAPFPWKQNKNLFSLYASLNVKLFPIVDVSLSYKEKAFNAKDKHQRQIFASVKLGI